MRKSINKTILIFTFIFSNIILKAQDDLKIIYENETNEESINIDNTQQNDRKFEHQFGFNATLLLQTILSSNGFFQPSPYQVNYKFLINTNDKCFLSSYGLRTGYGQYRNEDKVTSSSNNSFNSSSNKQTNFRIGIEVQKRLNDKWLVFAGIDYTKLKSNQESKNIQNNPPNNIKYIYSQHDKQTGIGPVFGIQFNVNKHIVLNTELSFYMNKGTSNNSQENITNGISNKITAEREIKNNNITIPAFINFNIRF